MSKKSKSTTINTHSHLHFGERKTGGLHPPSPALETTNFAMGQRNGKLPACLALFSHQEAGFSHQQTPKMVGMRGGPSGGREGPAMPTRPSIAGCSGGRWSSHAARWTACSGPCACGAARRGAGPLAMAHQAACAPSWALCNGAGHGLRARPAAWTCPGSGPIAAGGQRDWERRPCSRRGPCCSAHERRPDAARRPVCVQVLSCDVDLLHPSPELEKAKHKLKRLVAAPNSYFMDVKCQGCFTM